MACEIRMDGVVYTREEWDNVPLTVKLKALLQSPNLEKYIKLGVSRLKNGGVFTEVPVAQGAYDNAKSELSRVLDHAKTIRQKIKDVFGKHMDEKQVEYGLIMLDTMAHTWSERTGQLKELYYQRYQDVQQTTAKNILGRDNTLNQVIGQIGAESLDNAMEDLNTRLALYYAITYEEDFGVSLKDWRNNNVKREEKLKIKQLTGWERDTSGNWVYELPDGSVKDLNLLKTDSPTTLSEIYDSSILYRAYPQLGSVEVFKFNEAGDAEAYVWKNKIYLNENIISDENKVRKSLLHEIHHIVSEIEGFEAGGNSKRFELAIRELLQHVRDGNPESTLSESNRRFKQFYEAAFRGTPYALGTLEEESVQLASLLIYYRLEGEVFARNIENRSDLSYDENSMTLLSDTEDLPRSQQYPNILFQIIGEKGVLNLSDSVNRLQNLQLAKRMLSQGAPIGVIKRLTSWEQDDGVWKTETDDLWDFTVKRMPKQETESTLGELIGDAEIFEAYPQIKDIQIKFDNYDGYFSASYEPALNTITVNKQYITNLRQLKSSLVHEIQHAVQEIEGWQQGTNPEDVGSQENYRNAVGEVEARNASTRMDLTNQDKLESVLQDTADVAPEDRIYIENVTALAAGVPNSVQQSQPTTQYQDLEGNPVEGPPITYPTEFGDLSYIRDSNGDIVMVREPLIKGVEQEVDQALRNRTSDGLVYRAAVEAINNGNEFILYAIDKPDLGSLVHEFMHVAEQDLDDGDLETLERWSDFTKGTTEFREQVADGFVKFISEGSPELNSINAIFNKIAKMLRALYKRVLASPLDIKLNDDVRIIYAKIAGVEQGFTKRLKQATESVQELSDSQRKELLKLSRSLKRYAPSQLSVGTQVVKKDGSIGVVGREDLSGTTTKDRAEGITELLTYPLLVDLAGLYETTNKITPYGKPGITPSCT